MKKYEMVIFDVDGTLLDTTEGVLNAVRYAIETAGLPKEFIADHPDTAIRIPMGNDPDLRSLNLSNAVAVVLYEALRQHDFPDLI